APLLLPEQRCLHPVPPPPAPPPRTAPAPAAARRARAIRRARTDDRGRPPARRDGDSERAGARSFPIVPFAAMWAVLLLLLAPPPPRPQAADLQFLRDLAQPRSYKLGKPPPAPPLPDGSRVLFLRAEARKPQMRLYSFDVASGQVKELITPEQVLGGK